VTTKFRVWLTAAFIALAQALVVGFIIFMGMFTGESWCEDRDPWWGPPTDPNSTCSGHWYESRHPGEFPWTLPR
jgi:hypothetical protein